MLTIGICDDRLLSRRLLEALIHLYEEGKDVLFNIYEFSSGEELLAEIEKQGLVFDLLFLDNSMKKLTGLETARQIRQSKSSMSACNIVFVTFAEDHDQFMTVKPLQILCKPCTQEYIEAILEKVLANPLSTSSSSPPSS
ncbi:LytR/AlgR family response regulator transcription factor [Desulfosporosinus meridiei]|uniref:LytR/AlgR family response regulator transcription factor n=1 Tax=Desulfosporosinus meridiei TaxID=79209 RepID=UPI0005A656A0|nr:response regulator [Desulfosporosinus meridiei]